VDLPKLPKVAPDKFPNFAELVSWGISNPERFLELMREAVTLVAPGYYFSDNLFTWCRNNSLFEDAVFRRAWEDNCKNDVDRGIAWRRYVLACAAYHCIQLPGDFVECGVYYGTGIKTVMDYLGGKEFPTTFWAYDTFDYHPVEGHAFDGQQAGFFEKVQERFQGYPQVRLIKGLIPAVFDEHRPARISYLHIDLNHAESEIAALEGLFDLVVPGGIIVLDDYEWAGIYRVQKIAEDAWFDARQYRVMPLPTGQGLVFKR
jgi:hypothetical protein